MQMVPARSDKFTLTGHPAHEVHAAVAHVLTTAGFPAAHFQLGPDPAGGLAIVRVHYGWKLQGHTTPAILTRVPSPAEARTTHQQWIGQYKRALEDAGWDLATVDFPAEDGDPTQFVSSLAVYGQVLS